MNKIILKIKALWQWLGENSVPSCGCLPIDREKIREDWEFSALRSSQEKEDKNAH